MAGIVQNIIALGLVAVCLTWAARQAYKSLNGKRSKLGSCCQKGCSAGEAKPIGEKVHFLPSDMLKRRN
jgi:hypothetical protein